jgi:hypothetical protein
VQIVASRFTVSKMLISPGALVALVEAQEDPRTFVYRHIQGDWGEVGPEEWAENEYAVTHGERLFSIYHTRHGRTIWVVTEGGRYVATVLVPEEGKAYCEGRL